MEPISNLITTALITDLSTRMSQEAGRAFLKLVDNSPPAQKAFRRSVKTGLATFVAMLDVENADQRNHLDTILHNFFESEKVSDELTELLIGGLLDREKLRDLFKEAGYIPEQLPELKFDAAMIAFEQSFIAAAVVENDLAQQIQLSNLIEQSKIQRETRDLLSQIANILQEMKDDSLQIEPGKIVGELEEGNQFDGVKFTTELKTYFEQFAAGGSERKLTVSGNLQDSITQVGDSNVINQYFQTQAGQTGFSTYTGPIADWEEYYLKQLITDCNTLDIVRINPEEQGEKNKSQQMQVSDVFTQMRLKGISRQGDQSVADALVEQYSRKNRKEQHEKMLQEDSGRIAIGAVEAIAAVPKLVILGEPGGGKSTLVNHLTVQLARLRLEKSISVEQLPGWDQTYRPIPIRIVLRRFAAWLPEDTKEPDVKLLWDYLHEQLSNMGGEEFCTALKNHLVEEGGILFFDGLDEVSASDRVNKREPIVQAIMRISSRLSKCRVVVTCREYTYANSAKTNNKHLSDWRLPTPLSDSENGFPVINLALFDDEQIESFVNAWYQSYGKKEGWKHSDIQRLAKGLASAATNLAYLKNLAQYPLLLTLMALVHGRDGSLPNDRADLYERAIKLLLVQWDNAIVKENSEIEPGLIARLRSLNVRSTQLTSSLAELAFAAHSRQLKEQPDSEGAADIPETELFNLLKKKLGSRKAADIVIDYIQERSGLLLERSDGVYCFPHRTFQEFLAAQHIMETQGKPGDFLRKHLVENAGWWREVYLLAAGISKEHALSREDLVKSLLPSGKVLKKMLNSKTHDLILLAATALKEMGSVVPDAAPLRLQVEDWLKLTMRADRQLKANERAQSGFLLAHLGDSRSEIVTLEQMQFCLVPSGRFWQGKAKGDKDANEYEEPAGWNNNLSYDYWVAKYPVSCAQFQLFVKSGGYKKKAYWREAEVLGAWKNGQYRGQAWDSEKEEWVTARNWREAPPNFVEPWSLPNHPQMGISLHECIAFCRWASEKGYREKWLPKGTELRLPTEAEWEKAARGGEMIPADFKTNIVELKNLKNPDKAELIANPFAQRLFPWGNELKSNLCNFSKSNIKGSNAIGCFPGGTSPYGCEEMSGGIWESCSTHWRKSYKENSVDTLSGEAARVVRGGSYFYPDNLVRCSSRYFRLPQREFDFRGFRVVLSPTNNKEL